MSRTQKNRNVTKNHELPYIFCPFVGFCGSFFGWADYHLKNNKIRSHALSNAGTNIRLWTVSLGVSFYKKGENRRLFLHPYTCQWKLQELDLQLHIWIFFEGLWLYCIFIRWFFAQFVEGIVALAKNKPELIFLLELQSMFPAMQSISSGIMNKGKISLPCTFFFFRFNNIHIFIYEIKE
jgi:hypothetical protein